VFIVLLVIGFAIAVHLTGHALRDFAVLGKG
jgi:hypothetical protein